MSGKKVVRSEEKNEPSGGPSRRPKRWGIAMIAVGVVFLVGGGAAVLWAADKADAMTEEQRLQDPEQYDFYVSAELCSLGSVVIGLIIAAIGSIGVLAGRRPATVVKEGA